MTHALCGRTANVICLRLQRLTPAASQSFSCFFSKPFPNCTTCCITRQRLTSVASVPTSNCRPTLAPVYTGTGTVFHRFYRSSIRRSNNGEHKRSKSKQQDSENIDDLKSLMQDKSLGMTAKIKVLFQQYGVVLVAVHCITAAFWMGLFYFAVSRGFDIVPFLEDHGVFRFLEYLGLPASEKLKSPGASNLLAAYLLYEVAKPVRYTVTIIGTLYAVRLLRHLRYLKRPPKTDTTMRELVKTQGKIVRHHFKSTTTKYNGTVIGKNVPERRNVDKLLYLKLKMALPSRPIPFFWSSSKNG